MKKRVVFTFNEHSLTALENMADNAGKSKASVVRESLQLTRILQGQMRQGYTEVKVRNPETGEERVIGIPKLV